MDELSAIHMLREVMLGERRKPISVNSLQSREAEHTKTITKEKCPRIS